MKKIFIVSLFIACLGLGSCEKELDIVNPNQPTVEVFWKTADDAQQGVNAVYSTLHRGAISRWLPFYYIIRSDEGRSQSPATDIVNNMDQFRITDYNFWGSYDIWRDSYIGVFRANQVIANVPAIQMDEAQKQRVISEAKFLRGLFYFHLVTLWGNVPLMLEPSTTTDKPATTPQAQVWAQIEKDLSEAATVLPAKYTNPDDLGRATKGAAYALLAKAYLQQRKYNEALTPLQWLVTGEGSSLYSLMPDYRENFIITTENNAESVFEWQFQRNPTENHDDDTDPRADNLNYGTSIAQFFAPPGIGWSDGEAQRWVVHQFLKEPTEDGGRDPRLAATFLYDSTDVRGPNFTQIYGETFAKRYGTDNGQRVWFRKFLNDHWKNEEGYNSPNNWRYIRYADVLLMYAEALNATGSTAQAYPYVDRVRQRAGLAPLSTALPNLNQDQFLAQLKQERLLELAGEGHRWNDLTRWGDLGPELAQRDPAFSTFVKGKNELLPIPQQETDINPNLNQNPNY
ncbi:RagB/SusD family nutrient uptake outer membrane protein [Adhaeribacter arboris]|uniref:RagB/SusD family nutrient uptake outer membrane protein n=1 Tax=Adhaeribacter arboris TaxID=2072846 RepID=A0A2T2YIP3_9BACT|nr:RagB/SusD family nutrient uptake outer membrane protein [Adhaeribacter arboris]PSR55378.1 RagB/SusD family nutrient uptake outer membrane protein [Adhaeribacter arboris]